MPELERWEKKAMKREGRYQNTVGETASNATYEGFRIVANYSIRNILQLLRPRVAGWFTPAETQQINGKAFREGGSKALQTVGSKITVSVAQSGIDMTANAVDKYLTRDYFYPTGNAVASAAFGGRIKFDEDMGLQMYNECGYQPEFSVILNRLHSTAAQVDGSLTDVTWRKEVTPHMIRASYQAELENAFENIRTRHQKHPDLHNRQLMRAHMELAARRLGEIYEKFTLDLANNTEYLEAPMSFLPTKAPKYDSPDINKQERKLMSEVSRHSFFDNNRQINKRIDLAMEALPKPTTQQILAKFKHNLEKPIINAQGEEVLFQYGTDPREDQRRLDASILTLREMKQRSADRNFFSRRFTREGREETAAIEQMQSYIQEMLGLSPARIQSLSNLKIPMETTATIHEVMDIEPRERVKTVTEKIVDVVKQTGNVISNAADKIMDKVSDVLIGNDFMSDVNLFDGLDDLDDIWGGPSPVSMPKNHEILDIPQDPSSKVEPPKPVEEKPQAEEQPQVAEEQPEAPKQVASPDFTELMNDVNLFGDLDDMDEIVGSSSPAVQSQSQEVAEEPPEPQKEEPQPAQPQETSSKGFLGSIWSGVTYAASYLNFWGSQQPQEAEPVKPEVDEAPQQEQPKEEPVVNEASQQEQPKEHQSDPLGLIKDKQKEVIDQLRDSKTLTQIFFRSVATLMYLKTLEITYQDQKLDASNLDTHLSEECINTNAKKIMNEPAFQKMDMCISKGLAKRAKTFASDADKDPNFINTIHKQYVQKLQELSAESLPKQEPNEPVKNQDQPEKVNQPGI